MIAYVKAQPERLTVDSYAQLGDGLARPCQH